MPPFYGWPMPMCVTPQAPQAHVQVFPMFPMPPSTYFWQPPVPGYSAGLSAEVTVTGPGPSGKKRKLEVTESEEEEDSVELLDPAEALELDEFDPKVESDNF